MPILVDIPSVGEVEFPDGMSDDDIASAIQKITAPPAAPRSGIMGLVDTYNNETAKLKADPNSAFGEQLRQQERDSAPMITLPRAPQADSALGQVASGIYNGAIAPALEGLTSRNAIMSAPVAAAGRLASAALAPVMGVGAIQHGAQAVEQFQNPDATFQEKVEPIAGAVADVAMAAGAGIHALRPPKTPPNVTRRENTTHQENLGEGKQEIQATGGAANQSIQAVPGVSDLQGERNSGSAGLPSPEPIREEIRVELDPRQGQEIQIAGGNEEVRDPVRQLPPETSRGKTEAPQEPAPRTIETIGEGQLFRNDEIPFNLVGETDATAAEAAAAEELKAQEAAKAAQDAAQTKMFEEPKSQAPEPKSQAEPVKSQAPADPLLDALDADMQKAREAGDEKRLKTLAALKINYHLGKKPAIKKVEDTYGEAAQQPALPVGGRASKPMTKMQLFLEGPVAKFVAENGGFMSPTEARRIKGKEWWEQTGKGMYEALGRIPPAYGRHIFKKGGNASTPDDLMSAVGLRNADGGIEASPFGPTDTHHELLARLMDEVEAAKGGKSARGVTAGAKSHEQHMDELATQAQEHAATKGFALSVDDMSPGDTIQLPAESGGGTAKVLHVDEEGNVTISMPHRNKGKVVTMPAGHSLKVADHVRADDREAGADEPF